ncbi:MAG TPA: hypothetical protein VFQ61_19110 [Polyangiaceae bacterium]|nr:hypothetical protein [Polyangiaceae bacterium]
MTQAVVQPFLPEEFERIAGTPTITLGTALYVIRATVFDPVRKLDVAVPAHSWVLLAGAGSNARPFARSNASDSDGRAALMAQQSLPDGEYSLALVPFPSIIREGYLRDREAWIDLDRGDWALPPSAVANLERRRLVRIPAWSTMRKAASGGFKIVPPGSSQFATLGILKAAEIQPFGSPQEPWAMPLDFNWVKAQVRFFFSNWQLNQTEVVPPGLLVEAVSDRLPPRSNPKLGAGVALTPTDGSIYMLLEGDATLWRECQFQFVTPGSAYVDVRQKASAAPDLRLTTEQPVPEPSEDRNRLPSAWHSHGMRASFGDPSETQPFKKRSARWDDLRKQISKDPSAPQASVFFHLDDVVLCDEAGQPIAVPSKHQPPTLFDHFLRVHEQNEKKPYQSKVDFVGGGVIPAERAYPVGEKLTTRDKLLWNSTRLIHFEGAFYDLRDDRVTGRAGRTTAVGARSARRGQHPHAVLSKGNPYTNYHGPTELHAIDVPGVTDPSTGTPLQHVLIYQSVIFERTPDFPESVLPEVYRNLYAAGERWSPGHPGVHGKIQQKSYALVSQEPARRAERTTRIRTFLAETSSGAYITIVLKNSDQARSSYGDAWFLYGSRITYYSGAVRTDTAGIHSMLDKGDSVELPWHTLAHEFGHALGLPDEYCEPLQVEGLPPKVTLTEPVLPSFNQSDRGYGAYRPFNSDQAAMMNSNRLPRLRHFWHHVKILNEHPPFAQLPGIPYSLVHTKFGDSQLTYRVPPRDDHSPYAPIFSDAPIPGGHGHCAMWALGDDEGSVRSLFGLENAALMPDRMQGLLIVRVRFRFIFAKGISLERAWEDLRNFHLKLCDSKQIPQVRFLLGGGEPFPRIAVVIQPQYEIGPTLDPLDPADIVVCVHSSSSPPPLQLDRLHHYDPRLAVNPFLKDNPDSPLDILESDLLLEPLLRHALGARTWLSGSGGTRKVNLDALAPADVTSLARLVEQKLGEPSGRRYIGVY